jgi:hypothetical protein
VLAHRPAAHVPGGLDRELPHVKEVNDDLRLRQHPADGRGVDGAHVDGHDLDAVTPGRRRLGQPVRGVIGGAALDLAQQPLIPGQVEETRVPAVREQLVLAGLLIGPPAGPAAAMLVDPQVRYQGRSLR